MSGGAVSGIDAEFAVFAVGVTPSVEAVAVVESAVNGVQHALGPWTADGVYLNLAERPKTGRALFGSDDVHDRLRQVKSAYDAGDVIRSNHPVKPVSANAGR